MKQNLKKINIHDKNIIKCLFILACSHSALCNTKIASQKNEQNKIRQKNP